jgi:hypothetical protein
MGFGGDVKSMLLLCVIEKFHVNLSRKSVGHDYAMHKLRKKIH